MADKWNELGKMLSEATDLQRINNVKKIVTISKGNTQVLDWKDKMVFFARFCMQALRIALVVIMYLIYHKSKFRFFVLDREKLRCAQRL